MEVMRTNRFFTLLLFAESLMAACSPMEDDWWTQNEVISTNWMQANPETGRRPVGLDGYAAFYYPQEGEIHSYEYGMPDEKREADVQEGTYDILVTQKNEFITRTEMYRTTTLTLPTEYDTNGEMLISKNPEEMIYYGKVENATVREEVRTVRHLIMKRCLKKINFIVNVKDTVELAKDVDMDISGLATQMKMNNGMIDGRLQAVLKFPIHKYGRAENTGDGFLTCFRGYEYLLGVSGKNILYLSFLDGAGKRQKLSLDLTPHLHYWSTEEVTITLDVNAIEGDITAGEWSESSTDITIDL